MPMEGRGPDLRQAMKVTRPRRLAQGPATPPERVQKLQISLQAKAKAEPAFRFYSLWDKVCRARRPRRSVSRMPPQRWCGGRRRDDVRPDHHLRARPMAGKVAAGVVRRAIWATAPAARLDSEEQRRPAPAWIPCIHDRVVEMAALLVLSPIFEVDLLRQQYRLSSGLDAKTALRRVFWHVTRPWAIGGGGRCLSDYFSSIPHGPDAMPDTTNCGRDAPVRHQGLVHSPGGRA